MMWRGQSSTLFTLVGLLAWSSSFDVAVAGQPEAEACAAHLSIPGQKMFHATSGQVKPGTDIASVLRAHLRPMIMAGQIRLDEGKQNAQLVAKCLLLLK